MFPPPTMASKNQIAYKTCGVFFGGHCWWGRITPSTHIRTNRNSFNLASSNILLTILPVASGVSSQRNNLGELCSLSNLLTRTHVASYLKCHNSTFVGVAKKKQQCPASNVQFVSTSFSSFGKVATSALHLLQS